MIGDRPAPPFLDTNVLIRLVTQDEPDQGPRSLLLFDRVAQGIDEAQTSDTVLFELVFTLTTHYGWDRQRIATAVRYVLTPDRLLVETKAVVLAALELYLAHRRLSYADAFHLALARARACKQIISFDRAFDRVPGLARVEPPPVAT